MANEQPTEPNPTSKSMRQRSPAYPAFSLPAAIERCEKIWESQRKHAADFDSVIGALGYNAVSGPAQRAVGALGHYGLIDDNGRAKDRRIKLSDIALDILQCAHDDDRYHRAVKTAALSPAINRALWERWGATFPKDDKMIAPFLRRDKNYNDNAVPDVISAYRATFEFANLAEMEDTSYDEAGNESEDDQPEPERNRGKGMMQERADDANRRQKATTYTPVENELPILIGSGKIAKIPFPMTEDDFQLLLGTLNLWKKRLVPEEPKNEDSRD